MLFPEDRAEWIEQASGAMTAGPEKSGGYKLAGVRAGRYRIAAMDRGRLNQFYFDQPVMLAARREGRDGDHRDRERAARRRSRSCELPKSGPAEVCRAFYSQARRPRCGASRTIATTR